MNRWAVGFSVVLIGSVCALAACMPARTEQAPAATPAATEMLTLTPVPTLAAEPTATDPAIPQSSGGKGTPTAAPTPGTECPQVDVVYRLDYVHQVIQSMPQIQLKHEAEPGAAFYFTLRAGSVDSDDLENHVAVAIEGMFDDCALTGGGVLTADIRDRCVQGALTLDISER